jgi:hypothetical protein
VPSLVVGGPVTLRFPRRQPFTTWRAAKRSPETAGASACCCGPRETRLLFYGTPAEVSRLGGDPNSGPDGLTAAELPPSPPPFAFEPSATAPRRDAAPQARRPKTKT